MSRCFAPLPSRALIGVGGPDWRSFLQGLITQDVQTLRSGEMRYGALLTPQGRLVNDLFVTGTDESAVLDVSAEAREGLVAKLTLYRLRAKVTIQALADPVFATWDGEGAAEGEEGCPDPRLPAVGRRAYGSPPQGLACEEAAYNAHRLALGVPDPARDGAQSDYPIEANLDLLNGVDFKKGCFVGQETTSRMHRRGVVKTRMAPIAFQGAAPPFGAEILCGERRAGEVRGGIEGRAMALLRIDRVGDGPLTVEGRSVALELPRWLARSFEMPVDEPSPS